MAHAVDYAEGVANFTGNLAALAEDRKRWPEAETLAREALPLSSAVIRPAAQAGSAPPGEDVARDHIEALGRTSAPPTPISFSQKV